MDKELLARKLYVERVEALLGDQPMDEHILEEMWENRASPSEAAKAMTITRHRVMMLHLGLPVISIASKSFSAV